MEDTRIVALYWERSESAIAESEQKYGKYCHTIAYNILHDTCDAEECVNDTWLRAWNSIPPAKPVKLSAFLGKITRNLALNRLEADRAQKRGEGHIPLVLDELEECIPDASAANMADEIALRGAINAFLRSLPEETMIVFLQRYWYFMPIAEIAVARKMGESRVKVLLHRARLRLKELLKKEGIVL